MQWSNLVLNSEGQRNSGDVGKILPSNCYIGLCSYTQSQCLVRLWVHHTAPNSPANVVTPNANGLISSDSVYNSTLFGVGGGRSLVLLLSLGGSQHQFNVL